MQTRSNRTALIVAAAAALAPAALAQNAAFRLVAASSDSAPGAIGRVFSTFSFPAINDDGAVAFQALLTPVTGMGNNGVWSEGRTGALELVAQSLTTPAPGVPGAQFVAFTSTALPAPLLNDDGDAAFVATLTGGSIITTNDSGIWRQEAGTLELVVREGDATPGAIGVVFGHFDGLSGATFNEAGHVAFRSLLLGASVNSLNNFGIWSTSTGVLDKVARQRDPASGFAGDHEFLFLPPVLNGQGTLAFNGTVTGAGLQRGIWMGDATSLVVVARRGGVAPNTGGGQFNGFNESRFTPEINDSGGMAFLAELTLVGSGTSSIWSGGTGPLALIAREGAAAPGTAAVFAHLAPNFPGLLINGRGHIAFRAALAGVPAGVDSGVWVHRLGNLHLVAREGDAAPGAGGAVFGDMHPQFFKPIALNDADQVAIFAQLTGPGVTAADDMGIWMTDVTGNLQLVVREGQSVEVAPGVFRTVALVDGFLPNSGGQNGRARALNDNGELALRVRFDNLASGVIVASLPGCAPPVVYCLAAPNSVSQTGAATGSSGSQSIASNTFMLEASDLPQNTVGIFFYGDTTANAPFGNGIRCIGGTLFRLPVVQANAAGFASFHLDFGNLLGAGQILPGDTRHFQFWYRDVVAGGAFFNASSGLRAGFCN